MPVERSQRNFVVKRDIDQVGGIKKASGFFQRITLSKHPVDQLKGRDIGLSGVFLRGIIGVIRKIQGCHTEPFFIDRLRIERVAVHHRSHADDGVMPSQYAGAAEGDGVISRGDDHRGVKFIVQVHGASKVKVIGFHSDAGAHNHSPCIIFRKIFVTDP